MGILYIILLIFVIFGGAFGIYRLDLIKVEEKKHEVLRDAVIADINNVPKGTQVDLKSHLSRYYKSYEITQELVKYCVDNYQTVFLQELQQRHKNTPHLSIPVKKQLNIESITRKLENMRAQQKQEIQ